MDYDLYSVVEMVKGLGQPPESGKCGYLVAQLERQVFLALLVTRKIDQVEDGPNHCCCRDEVRDFVRLNHMVFEAGLV